MQYTYLYSGALGSAENEQFSWSRISHGHLFDKATGRSIYQMSRLFSDRFGSEPITAKERESVLAFFAAMREEESKIIPELLPALTPADVELADHMEKMAGIHFRADDDGFDRAEQ